MYDKMKIIWLLFGCLISFPMKGQGLLFFKIDNLKGEVSRIEYDYEFFKNETNKHLPYWHFKKSKLIVCLNDNKQILSSKRTQGKSEMTSIYHYEENGNLDKMVDYELWRGDTSNISIKHFIKRKDSLIIEIQQWSPKRKNEKKDYKDKYSYEQYLVRKAKGFSM